MKPSPQREADQELMKVIGLRIYKARLRAGLDLNALATLASSNYQTLRTYDAGTSIPNVFAGIRLAKALRVSAEDLYLREPTAEEKREASEERQQILELTAMLQRQLDEKTEQVAGAEVADKLSTTSKKPAKGKAR